MSSYSSRKLELLALKWAVTEQFINYLAGGHFIVLTENNPLAHLKMANLGVVESRWLGDLNRFDFELRYWAGKKNANVDGLSHRPQAEELEDGEEVHELWEGAQRAGVSGQVAVVRVWEKLSLEQMQDEQKACPLVGKLWVQMIGHLSGGYLRAQLQLAEFRKLWRMRVSLFLWDSAIYWRGEERDRRKCKPVLPLSKREEVLRAAHEH